MNIFNNFSHVYFPISYIPYYNNTIVLSKDEYNKLLLEEEKKSELNKLFR